MSKIFFRCQILRSGFTGMRGLSNDHLSCCVNTLLQTFSATWELAELLDRWRASGVQLGRCSIPLQLQKTLSAMRSDLSQPAPHHDFLHCLHENNIRLHVQHDADEVFLYIMTRMQKQIHDEALALEIQNLYKISVRTELQCLECSSVQTNSSYLLRLPLYLKEDHNTMDSCISSYFEPQELRGRDLCYCPQCESRTPSRQGVKLHSLPPVLCMHLKRFRNRSGIIHKLHDEVSFPETFDVSETFKGVLTPDSAQSDCRYTLYAVVVHSGTVMCGHYTAYVRHRENQGWYYADDSHVKPVSWGEVTSSYGGRHSRTAYMLMYRRGPKDAGQQLLEFSG